MTTALEGGEGSASRPGRSLPPGKTRYPLYRRLVGPQGRSGQVRKISPPSGLDPQPVQPVASRYTNWATRPNKIPYQHVIWRAALCTTFGSPVPLSPRLSVTDVAQRALKNRFLITVHKFVTKGWVIPKAQNRLLIHWFYCNKLDYCNYCIPRVCIKTNCNLTVSQWKTIFILHQ